MWTLPFLQAVPEATQHAFRALASAWEGWAFKQHTVVGTHRLDVGAPFVPIGGIIRIGTTDSTRWPVGYLRADGRAVSRSTYQLLFRVLGTEHGAGNGTTSFNLPNITVADNSPALIYTGVAAGTGRG